MTHRMGAVAAFLALLLVSCASNQATVTLTNRATEPIQRVTIVVSGQTLSLGTVDVSAQAVVVHQISTDGHYAVDVELRSGRHLVRNVGYVARGFDTRQDIVVTDSDIQISSTIVDR